MMLNLTEEAETALIERQRLPENFGPEAVRPGYDGLSLANVPALAAQILAPQTLDKAEFGPTVPPLDLALLDRPEINAAFQRLLADGPINHVVVLLMDALGYDQLKSQATAGYVPTLQNAIQNPDNFFIPLTSVYPSTTTTALTSVATARTPQEHGIMGTVNRFPELGSLVNLIYFGPTTSYTSFAEKYLNPDTLVPVANIYKRLESAGIKCEHINFHGFKNSSISRFTTADSQAEFIGYLTAPTAFATLRQQLDRKPEDGSLKSFTYCYVSNVDNVAHRYGPLTKNYEAELAALDFSLNRELFSPLKGRKDILLMLVADHGQRQIDPQKVVWLHEHPELTRLQVAPVGGERRTAYLYLKPGTVETARRYIEANFGEHFLALSKDEALEMDLFGLSGQEVSPKAEDRLGDLIMIPRQDWIVRQFVTTDDSGPGSTGVHGGLSRAEMLIPFLAMRF